MEKVGTYQGLQALLEEFKSLNGPRVSSDFNTGGCYSDTDNFTDSLMDVSHGLESDFRAFPFEYLSDPGQNFPELACELVNVQEAQFTELHSKEAALMRLTVD